LQAAPVTINHNIEIWYASLAFTK